MLPSRLRCHHQAGWEWDRAEQATAIRAQEGRVELRPYHSPLRLEMCDWLLQLRIDKNLQN